jgi:phage shock protein C
MKTNGETLSLNEADKRFLGVCSGFARYLDVPVIAVRLIYAIACIIWPTLIIVYFVSYWCLKKDNNSGRLKAMVNENRTIDQLKRLDYRRPLYRNPDDRKIAGVCSGIADYLNINPFIVRLLTFFSVFVFGPFTFFAYIVFWMVMQKRPAGFSYSGSAEQVQAGEQKSKGAEVRSIQECGSLLSQTESRLREVEAFMTSKQFSLHCEINRIA